MDTTDTSKDEYIRKEFARAFGWWKSNGNYSGYGENMPRLPSWEEIFIEVGRMLNTSQRLSDEYRFRGLEERMGALESYLNSKKDRLP